MVDLIQSFGFACSGLFSALSSERNFRLHWLSAIAVFMVAGLVDFYDMQNTIIILLVAIVLALELINSALEHICDESGQSFSLRKKHAKDMAAAAVLLCACAAALIFFTILYDHQIVLITMLAQEPWPLFGVLAVALLGLPHALSGNGHMIKRTLFAAALAINCVIMVTYQQQTLFAVLAITLHSFWAFAIIKQIVLAKRFSQAAL